MLKNVYIHIYLYWNHENVEKHIFLLLYLQTF